MIGIESCCRMKPHKVKPNQIRHHQMRSDDLYGDYPDELDRTYASAQRKLMKTDSGMDINAINQVQNNIIIDNRYSAPSNIGENLQHHQQC